jgi:hypothetical protein
MFFTCIILTKDSYSCVARYSNKSWTTVHCFWMHCKNFYGKLHLWSQELDVWLELFQHANIKPVKKDETKHEWQAASFNCSPVFCSPVSGGRRIFVELSSFPDRCTFLERPYVWEFLWRFVTQNLDAIRCFPCKARVHAKFFQISCFISRLLMNIFVSAIESAACKTSRVHSLNRTEQLLP